MLNDVVEAVELHLRSVGKLDPDMPLLTTGLIDSFRLAALLTTLESRFDLHIDPADVGADNFDTARDIATFIAGAR